MTATFVPRVAAGYPSRIALRVALALAVTLAGYLVLAGPARHLEALAAVSILRALGARDVFVSGGAMVGIIPPDGPAFHALVTSTCSSLSSLLALACLGRLMPPRPARSRAIAAALGVVAVGNVVRITASVAMGLVAGRASLVLFHDWVGSLFAFGYTLGGYILMVALLLPKQTASTTAVAP
jgi:exosortase/archaeosortase family protein